MPRLENLADELNKALREFESSLRNSNLYGSVWVEMSDGYSLGWCQDSTEVWKLHCGTPAGNSSVLLGSSSLISRLLAVENLQKLLDALVAAQVDSENEVAAAIKQVRKLMVEVIEKYPKKSLA